jgi:alkanesulfonate monooxygenase SsuD/methylene tetrahydromethanopterin reductase-like flavin-dependent oxidoreductase (luciferase family)
LVLFSIAPAIQRLDGGKRVFDAEGFLAECQAAERCGWTGGYTGEKHRGDTSYSPSPLVVCGYGLANTERMRFGTCVSVLPVHHPVALAEEASVLDALYPGRFRLTVGAGYFAGDFEPFGVPVSERDERMVEGMIAIDAYRRGEPHTFERFWDGTVPARDPALGEDKLELFVGAWSVPGVRRAARHADGWITDPIRSGRWIAHLAEVYCEECAKLGKEPRIVLFREAWLGESDEAARATYGPHVLGYSQVYFVRGNAYNERFDPWLKDVSSADDLTLDHVLPDRVLLGSSETWVEQIQEWQESLQPEELLVRLRHFQGPSVEATVEAIEAISETVIPKLAA